VLHLNRDFSIPSFPSWVRPPPFFSYKDFRPLPKGAESGAVCSSDESLGGHFLFPHPLERTAFRQMPLLRSPSPPYTLLNFSFLGPEKAAGPPAVDRFFSLLPLSKDPPRLSTAGSSADGVFAPFPFCPRSDFPSFPPPPSLDGRFWFQRMITLEEFPFFLSLVFPFSLGTLGLSKSQRELPFFLLTFPSAVLSPPPPQ